MGKYSSNYFKAYYQKNKARRAAQGRFRRYGITQEDFDKRFQEQGSRCKICGAIDPGSKSGWHVDHDHETKIVRAILCAHCNRLLGAARDNPDILRKAATFLDLMYVAY